MVYYAQSSMSRPKSGVGMAGGCDQISIGVYSLLMTCLTLDDLGNVHFLLLSDGYQYLLLQVLHGGSKHVVSYHCGLICLWAICLMLFVIHHSCLWLLKHEKMISVEPQHARNNLMNHNIHLLKPTISHYCCFCSSGKRCPLRNALPCLPCLALPCLAK